MLEKKKSIQPTAKLRSFLHLPILTKKSSIINTTDSKTINIEDSSSTTSDAQTIDNLFVHQKKQNISLKEFDEMNRTKERLKGKKQNNFSSITTINSYLLPNLNKRESVAKSFRNSTIQKNVNFKAQKEIIDDVPLVEDFQTLQTLQMHPRLRKSTISKTDTLLEEWLQKPGGLTTSQKLILGNSKRISRKISILYLNNCSESRLKHSGFTVDETVFKGGNYIAARFLISSKSINPDLIISNLVNYCDWLKAIEENLDKISLKREIAKFLEEMTNLNNLNFFLFCQKIFAKCLYIQGQVKDALKLYKAALLKAKSYRLYRFSMSLYKRIGLLEKEFGNYDRAMSCFIKMLRISWILNDSAYELTCYDCMGVVCFYKKDLHKAKIFHNKLIIGKLEPENSNKRLFGMMKMKREFEKYIDLKRNRKEEESDGSSLEKVSLVMDSDDDSFDFGNINKNKAKNMTGSSLFYSHLSNNRTLKNFQKASKMKRYDYIKENREMIICNTENEKVKNKLKKLRNNMEVAMFRIASLKNKLLGDKRRAGLFIKNKI